MRADSIKMRRVLYRYRYQILTAMMILVVYWLYPAKADTSDDLHIMNYISGLYTGQPGVMAFYMQVPYSVILRLLYSITTRISWYTVAFLVIEAAAVVVISRLIVHEDDSIGKFVCYLGIVIGLYLNYLVQLQYTTVAGFAGAAAVTAVCGIRQEDVRNARRMRMICAVIFLYLCVNIRNQSFPVVMVVMLYAVLASGVIMRRQIRSQVTAVTVCLIIAIASYGINEAYCYMHPEWREYATLQTSRGRYLDYNHPTYEGNEELYDTVGWDESATELIRNWSIRLDEANAEDFDEIVQLLQDSDEHRTLAQRVGQLVGDTWRAAHSYERETIFMGMEGLLLLLCWIASMLRRYGRRECLYATGFYLLQWAFVFYLILGGRVKERALWMTFIICSTPMLRILLNQIFASGRYRIPYRIGGCILLLAIAGLGYQRERWHTPADYNNVDWAEEYVLNHKENIYVADDLLANQGRISHPYTEETQLTNLFYIGHWLEGCPMDLEQNRLNGFDRLVLPDMLAENCYYIGTNIDTMERLENYYTARYGEVTCNIVAQQGEVVVYSFRLTES